MQNEAVKYTASSKSMLFQLFPEHAGPQSLLHFQLTVADRIL